LVVTIDVIHIVGIHRVNAPRFAPLKEVAKPTGVVPNAFFRWAISHFSWARRVPRSQTPFNKVLRAIPVDSRARVKDEGETCDSTKPRFLQFSGSRFDHFEVVFPHGYF